MIDLSSLPPPLPSSSIDWYSHYYYRISYQYSSSYPLQKSDPLLLIDPANPPSLSPSKLIKKRRLSSSDDDDDNDNNNDYYYECDDRGGASDHIPIIMGGIKMEGGELFQNSISNSNNINNSDGNNDNNNNDQQQQNCLYHYQYDYNTVNNNNHHNNNNNNNNNNNTSPSDPTDTIISPSTTTDCISTDEWDNSSDPFYSSIAPHLASSESDFSSSPLSDYYDADLFSSLPPSGVEELPPLSIEWINNNNNNNTFNNNNNNNYSTTTNNKLQLDLSIFSQSNTMRMEETPRSLPSFTPAPAPAPAVTASVSTPFSSSMSLLSYPDLSDDIKSRLSHQINLLQSLSYLPNPNQYYSFSSSSLYQIAQQFIHKINNQSLNLLQRYLTPSPSLLNNNNNNNNTINTTTNNNNDSSTVRAAASKAGVPHNHTPILTASAIYLSLHLVSLTNDNNNDYNNNNNSSNNNNNTTISISNFSLLDYYFRDHLPSHRELSRLLSISQSSLQQCSAKIKEKLLIQFSNKQGGGIIEKIKKKKAKFI